MARDRPSPYGEREAALDTVARGPVPRDRSICAKIVHRPRPFSSRSRHGEGQALALRAAETALDTVARGPVPRDRSTRAKIVHRPRTFPLPIGARRGTGPRPTVNGTLFHRDRPTCAKNARQPKAVSRSAPAGWILGGKKNSASKEKSNVIYCSCNVTAAIQFLPAGRHCL